MPTLEPFLERTLAVRKQRAREDGIVDDTRTPAVGKKREVHTECLEKRTERKEKDSYTNIYSGYRGLLYSSGRSRPLSCLYRSGPELTGRSRRERPDLGASASSSEPAFGIVPLVGELLLQMQGPLGTGAGNELIHLTKTALFLERL